MRKTTVKKPACCDKPFFMKEALNIIPTTDEDTPPVITNRRLRPDGSARLRPDGSYLLRP